MILQVEARANKFEKMSNKRASEGIQVHFQVVLQYMTNIGIRVQEHQPIRSGRKSKRVAETLYAYESRTKQFLVPGKSIMMIRG